MPSERNNIVAGIATLAVVGAAAGLIWAAKAWNQSRQARYVVHFSARQGVYGLREDTPVLVGGLPRGHVERIEAKVADGKVTGYDVVVRLPREVPVYRRARFEALSAGINGESVLSLSELGRFKPIRGANPQPEESGLLPPGSTVPAADPQPFRAGFGRRAERPIADLEAAWFPEDPAAVSLGSRLESIFKDARPHLDSLESAGGTLRAAVRADYPEWKSRYEAAREDAESALSRLGIGNDPPPGSISPEVRALKADLDALPDLGLGRASAAGDAFDAAIASVKALGARSGELRALLEDEETSIGASNADFSIAAQELSATETEAILAPWRLVGSPSDAQRRDGARIALARAYAEAAAEHQRAMKAIEDALRRDGALLAREPGLAGLLRTRLDAASALFESEAGRMEGLLLGPSGPAAR